MGLKPERLAVIGAGIIGSAVAHALSMEGREVTLFDRLPPGEAGASYGNVAHIAAELVQPLPSRQLLMGFWRELFCRGGPLDIPLRRLPFFTPWALRFVIAAFRRDRNTRHLAPLVKPAASEFNWLLRSIGRTDLLKRNGHYQVWFGDKAQQRANDEAASMRKLDIPTAPADPGLLKNIALDANASSITGLHFPDSAHVVDPMHVVRALADAAIAHGTQWQQTHVQALLPRSGGLELVTERGSQLFEAAVVCAGPWSAPLLEPFGLKAPLEAVYGYHIELQQHPAHVDAPLIYMDRHILVTPLDGRLRASSFMEFSGLDSAADPRKPLRLRQDMRSLGYRCAESGPAWKGARPILPDYLPGIGRAPSHPRLFYAIGHQHLGLTMAPVTGRLIADLVAERTPGIDVSAFDLQRFGSS